jgi:hypothetical protein
MAPKPIDHEFLMHAFRAGGHQARQKMHELKDKLKDFHNNTSGSEVRQDEKGCFGGAYNAWFRAGCPGNDESVLFQMATVEAYQMDKIFDLISVDVSWDKRMTDDGKSAFMAFEMELDFDGLTPIQLIKADKFLSGLVENGEAKYESE